MWLYGKVKTPPFTRAARSEAGFLLRRLQRGERLEMPHSRPMPTLGARCHELRIVDANSVRPVRNARRAARPNCTRDSSRWALLCNSVKSYRVASYRVEAGRAAHRA